MHETMLDAIAASGEGLIIIDADYHVRYMNSVMEGWFGEQTGNKCYHDLIGWNEPCSGCRMECVLQGDSTTYQPTLADGRTFEIIATPIRNRDGLVVPDFRSLEREHTCEVRLGQ